ncbi:alpha/beta hydrolase [Vannielia litorea]|uniref:Acetyl esterase/lipase n=1 Tax=Vannielia litorea TaxID=1217970 RepID=A0A1N6FY32_9RHOB|nr:alpha/beta hydrolase [Vannielia litorea]SIO00266.1 Acetyl esterase/lipase [Vannielia litorea]
MIVTKDMVHGDLRSRFRTLSALRLVFGNRVLVSALNALVKRTYRGRDIDGLVCGEILVPGHDGTTRIRTRIYRPSDHDGDLPAMLYIHGGGYISGIPEQAANEIRRFIETRPCVVIAPDYRLALEAPYPAAFDDCYDTLLWVRDNAQQLGINPDRIIVAGHSAGGGLTAAVTLKARDTGDVKIAFQMPIYPMIDDTQPDDPAREILGGTWDSRTNRFGWQQYLRDLRARGQDIPAHAAPARNQDYSGFPPTISFVGTIEPFYPETVTYIEALKAAGIDTRFEAFEGCFHGFEIVAADTPIGQRGQRFTYDSYADFYDAYAT